MDEAIFFGRLRKQYDQNLPFVAYRKPAERIIHSLLQKEDTFFTSEDLSETGFVFAPFDTRKKAVLIPEEGSEKLIFEQQEDFEIPEKEKRSERSNPSEADKEKHISLVKKGLLELNSGNLQKVVLSRKEKVELEQSEPFELFKELLNLYSTAFVYLWYHPETGLWLGATPETLLKVEGRTFKTMALAGTQKFHGAMEVEWGEKEKQEQQYVTDSILEDLEKVGVSSGTVESSEVYTAKAGNLLHLRTDISGRLAGGEHLGNIIKALHPTPAVCGLPKEKAQNFILSEENYDREFYTGFLGELNLQSSTSRSGNTRNVENLAYRTVKKETALFVNLRCMKLRENAAYLYVGGGITKDSNTEAEWEETVNKSQTMKKVLF